MEILIDRKSVYLFAQNGEEERFLNDFAMLLHKSKTAAKYELTHDASETHDQTCLYIVENLLPR